MACWQDAALWWAHDDRTECEQSMHEKEETERLRLVEVRKMERKERRLSFLAKRDVMEREVAVAARCRGQAARMALFIEVAKREGFNPGEVMFWDERQPFDPCAVMDRRAMSSSPVNATARKEVGSV